MPNNPKFGFQSGYAASPKADGDSSGFGFQAGYGSGKQQNPESQPWYQALTQKIEGAENAITPSMLKDVGQAVSSRPELQPYGPLNFDQKGNVNVDNFAPSPDAPIRGAMQAALQTVGSPIRAGATIANAPNVFGEAASNIGQQTGHPLIGAGVGAVIQTAPYAAVANLGWKALQQSTNPVLRGLINTPQELGPQYAAQNEAIGISNRMPESSGSKATFPNPYGNTLSTKPPPALNVDTGIQSNLRGAEPLPSTSPLKYPANNEAFVNYADQRLNFGDKLSPQELSDIKYKADGAITSAKQALQSNMADKAAKTLLARASQIRTQANTLLNKVASEQLPQANLPPGTIPTRPGLNTAYGIASRQQAIQKFIQSLPRYAGYSGGAIGGLGAAGYGIKKAYELLAGNE